MTLDDVAKLLDAIAKFLAVLVWPVLIGIVIFRFGPALKEFFTNLSEFSLKGGGFEASAKRTQAAAAAALAAAVAAHPEPGATPETTAKDAQAVADVVAEIVTP